MPSFKSVEGIWFARDKATQAELKQAGIDHLGIHTSEDPYIKQMEYITGIPRHELTQGSQRQAMDRMMEQMQANQLVMTMLLAGDKDGALSMLKDIQQQAVDARKKSEQEANVDPVQRAKDEFRESMGGSWNDKGEWIPYHNPSKKVPEKTEDLKNLPEKQEAQVPVNASVIQDGESTGQGGFKKDRKR